MKMIAVMLGRRQEEFCPAEFSDERNNASDLVYLFN